MQKLSLYETTKMCLSLTLTLTDILHVFIEKCKSRITIHVKVKTLKRKQHQISSYTFRKEKTPTSIYLSLTLPQVLCTFKLVTHHLPEQQTLLNFIVLQ
jgi:regulator of PEP synthase PpsR (kinase-PPPase family)